MKRGHNGWSRPVNMWTKNRERIQEENSWATSSVVSLNRQRIYFFISGIGTHWTDFNGQLWSNVELGWYSLIWWWSGSNQVWNWRCRDLPSIAAAAGAREKYSLLLLLMLLWLWLFPLSLLLRVVRWNGASKVCFVCFFSWIKTSRFLRPSLGESPYWPIVYQKKTRPVTAPLCRPGKTSKASGKTPHP